MRERLVEFDNSKMTSQGKKPGWKRGTGNIIVVQEELGVYVRHVMWESDDQAVTYDQILRAEQGGGVFLPVDEQGRIGLQKMWRPQTRSQQEWARRFPQFDVTQLGRESYEVPRGFPMLGESGELTAVREAEEETGSSVVKSQKQGYVCDNTAFSPHLTVVVFGELQWASKPARSRDPNEQPLERLEFFTREQVAQLQREGKLYDGITLAAIAIFLLQASGSWQATP